MRSRPHLAEFGKHGPGCPEHTIRADYPETAELAELREIQATQGMDAIVERSRALNFPSAVEESCAVMDCSRADLISM
jgi:hypothetical protein